MRKIEPIAFVVLGLIMLFGAFAVVNAQETAPKPPTVDVAKLNAQLAKDHRDLKNEAKVQVLTRDNSVLTYQNEKAAFDKKTEELNKQFNEASIALHDAIEAIYKAVGVSQADVAFDPVKGEFVLPAPKPPAAPDSK